MDIENNKPKRARKPKVNFADKQFENSIQESENKQVSQYEKRQEQQKQKDEEWKRKRDEIGENKFKQIVAEQFKPANKPKRYRKVLSFKINDIWAVDLVEFQDETIIKDNDGYKYILFVVDLYSRYAFGRAMKNKTSVETLTAFKQIMTEAKAKPKKLWRDEGKEFYGEVGKYLKTNTIEAYSTYGTHKANVVERFNRTMKNNMYKMFLYNNNYEWTKHLQELIDQYNNSPHRGIQKYTPYQVYREGQMLDTMPEKPNLKPPKFKVGDKVKISKQLGKFDRGYKPKWKTEVFEVKEVKKTSPYMYVIKDKNDEVITGAFYEEELQKTVQDKDVELLF